jgi:hypothetical protein
MFADVVQARIDLTECGPTLLMKEREKPGKFLLPHGMILLECRGLCIFMEDDP